MAVHQKLWWSNYKQICFWICMFKIVFWTYILWKKLNLFLYFHIVLMCYIQNDIKKYYFNIFSSKKHFKNNRHCSMKHHTSIFIRWSSYQFYVWNTNDILICFSYWTPPYLNKTLNNRLEWKRGSMFVLFRFLERIVRIRYPMQSIWKKNSIKVEFPFLLVFLSLFQKSLGTLKIASQIDTS